MPNNTISSWYNSQYRVWDRTRRLQMAPFLAQAERGGAPAPAAAEPPNAVTIDMSHVAPADKESHSEALFGPPIPADAATLDSHIHPAQPHDQVSQAVVDGWVEKSKQGHEPATTLQALVNLKRPSLRLTPLASNASNPDLIPEDAKATHGLEFDYDCDAAKCRIVVTMAPNLPSTSTTSPEAEKSNESTVIFDGVVDGGFGRTLKHEHGAILDLAHHDDTKEADAPVVEEAPAPEPVPTIPEPTVPNSRSRRRISVPFHIRRRERGPQQATGPALPVVDAEAQNVAEGSSKDHAPKDVGGVHVSITLEALNEAGEPYTNRNSQATALHVVKMGQAPADGAEDTRSWVVRVLRREATIGTHTFRLHEIYGLANAAAPSHPTAPSYPPVPASTTDADGEALPDASTQQQTYEFAGAECVLCLSSPREVVLLPCRHLVACKECADNMITFGAGEGVSAPTTESNTEPTTANGTNGANGTGAGSGPNNSVPEPLTPFQTAAAAGRRKRKAKGWFCPVCRQPYTSMLRISMHPLNIKADDTSSVDPAPNEADPQMQSKGALSGMVSIARDMLGRKTATESPNEAGAAAPGQSTTANPTPSNNV